MLCTPFLVSILTIRIGTAYLVLPRRTFELIHGEHHAKLGLAAQHAVVAGSGLFEWERLNHGANPREGVKIQRVFRISSRPCWPPSNGPTAQDELYGCQDRPRLRPPAVAL